jgi:hypothetical protein
MGVKRHPLRRIAPAHAFVPCLRPIIGQSVYMAYVVMEESDCGEETEEVPTLWRSVDAEA